MWTYSGLVEEYKLALCKLYRLKNEIEEKMDLIFMYNGYKYKIGIYDLDNDDFRLYCSDDDCEDPYIKMTADELDALDIV